MKLVQSLSLMAVIAGVCVTLVTAIMYARPAMRHMEQELPNATVTPASA